MNTDNTTHNPGWQVLGELELPVGASVEETLKAWLTELLHPLNLQSELLDKIILSAQDAATRAAQTGILRKFEHVHLTIFVPLQRDVKEQTWGFFRLEKVEDAKDEEVGSDHAVEFYLYGEGD